MATPDQKTFITRVADAARAYPGITRALIVVTVAQAIQESGWGTTPTVVHGNNYFGAAADLGDVDTCANGRWWYADNVEEENGVLVPRPRWFYTYPTLAASVASHLDFITGQTGVKAYQARPIPTDPYGLVRWLVTPPRAYATDSTYVTALTGLIDTHNLTALIPDAAADMKETPAMVNIAAQTAFARKIITSNTGYGQDDRNSFSPDGRTLIAGKDCDCSSSCAAIANQGGTGFPWSAGLYTGNIGAAFKAAGYTESKWTPASAGQEGDFVVAPYHHVIYDMGGDVWFSAEANEKGTATGGQPGNQNGLEVRFRGRYDMTAGGTRVAYLYRHPQTAQTTTATAAVASSSGLPTLTKGVDGGAAGQRLKAWLHAWYTSPTSMLGKACAKIDPANGVMGDDTWNALTQFAVAVGLLNPGQTLATWATKCWAKAAAEGFKG